MFVGKHFNHFCRQLKNGQLDKLSAKVIKNMDKMCLLCVFRLSNNTSG